MTNTQTQQISTSQLEFPRGLLPLLRCSRDAGEFSVCQEKRSGDSGVIDGILRCTRCSAEYRIEDGIARLRTDAVTPELEHEIALMDQDYKSRPDTLVTPDLRGPAALWPAAYKDLIEVPPHLDALAPLEDRRVLELACGDGRFTLLMAQMGAEVLAVDISIEGLRKLSKNLLSGLAPTVYQLGSRRRVQDLRGHVGLVQADASHFHVAPRSFDRALYASPLDGRDERMRMYRTIAKALKDNGRLVGGVEHDDLIRRLFGMPLARRYAPGNVLFEHFDTSMMRREAAPFFSRLQIRPIRPYIPFVVRLPIKHAASLTLALGNIPLLRQLGEILLLCADRPIRAAAEGVRRPGSNVAKRLYRLYKRWVGKEPIWESDRV